MNKSLSSGEVLLNLHKTLVERYDGHEIDVTAVSEIVTVYHGSVGFMVYKKIALIKVSGSEWAISVGSGDGTNLTRNFGSDIVLIKVSGVSNKVDYVVDSIEKGKYFINSLLYSYKNGEFHINCDGVSKGYHSLILNKIRENKLGQLPNLRYMKDIVQIFLDVAVSIMS